jgi:hypothetical protein
MSVAYAGINRPGIDHQLRRRESHKFAAVIRIEPPVGRHGECRDDGCNVNGGTVTLATKILVAKSLPRASNQVIKKASGGMKRVYHQIDGER